LRKLGYRLDIEQLDEAEITSAVDAAFDSLAHDKTTWPTTTDRDRLDSVFAALNTHGIIAVQNAGYAQSDGYDNVLQIYAERSDRDTIIGYCFYHGQDLDRATEGQGLHLACGPMNAQKEQTEVPRIGAMIADEPTRAGSVVASNGTFAQRIFVPCNQLEASSLRSLILRLCLPYRLKRLMVSKYLSRRVVGIAKGSSAIEWSLGRRRELEI
jgi:hypothetical protein